MSHDSSLEPVLRAVEPAARLVPERRLRQILNYLRDWGHPLPTNPTLPYWVNRSDLIDADILPEHTMEGTEPSLLLITDPNDRMIDRLPAPLQLREYWEVLFEAAVMREIDHKLEQHLLTPNICRERLNRFGAAMGREIRYVLESEHIIAEEVDSPAVYRAFAAVYLRTAAFRPERLEELFPSLPHGDVVSRALAEDVDHVTLLARCRPSGAADPHREPGPEDRWAIPEPLAVPPVTPPDDIKRGLERALEAERNRNFVRAAILRLQVAAVATGEQRESAQNDARTVFVRLIDSLGDMFEWDHDTRQEWRQALSPLLEFASAGVWPRAARCLYELQKITADLSRDVYAVDLAESIRTFGKRPVKRPLPRAKPVLILMGLRKAHSQLMRSGLGEASTLRLDRLFHHQIERLSHGISHDFTPLIKTALDEAGLVPTNTVEEVGRDKLVAELIDRICTRGYLRIGDLRDAVARNRLKLGDLKSPGEFVSGDPLLKADINLTYALDGVHRKGEFYLRGLQRASSLFFATAVGRALFLYLMLPFAGAFMTVVGAQEMSHIGQNVYYAVEGLIYGVPSGFGWSKLRAIAPKPVDTPVADDVIDADEIETDEEGNVFVNEAHPATLLQNVLLPTPPAPEHPGHGKFHVPWEWVAGLTVVIFFLIHAPPFRYVAGQAVLRAWWLVRGVLWDLPMGLWQSAIMRGFRQSRFVRLLFRYFWSPLLLSFVILGAMWLGRVPLPFLLRWGWLVWVVLTVAYNTPWGWVLQDRFAEAVSDWWRVVRVNLLPGLIATILDWFRRLANWIERQLYAVDERLRFRGGDSQGSLAVKAVLGLFWFPVAYVFRFAFYLLLEPQVNPVKHFPVVTVSHKLLLPLVPSLGEILVSMTGWGVMKANAWAFGIIACIPGVFGFMAWELLANWLLYKANRVRRLRPVTLGSHGETMRGLLRPGFHSGTVPKLYRKLRKAVPQKAGHLHHELDHVAEAIHAFMERELVHLLHHCEEWNAVRLEVGEVRCGCLRVSVQLLAPDLGRDPFIIAFENIGGVIAADLEQLGWVDKLTTSQRAKLVVALRGILDMAAVERVGGHERSLELPPAADLADLSRRMTWDEWCSHWNRK